ncbi:MAG: helix-turn-helix transcriptional regulator [bacterium]|nr:helix-turn-helix transcriptional regulator [bacterium]
MNHQTISNRLSGRFKVIRESTGKKQKQMAREIGVTYETYNRYEKGQIIPSLHILKRVAVLYRISLDWLLLNRGPMYFEEKEGEKETCSTIST